MSETRHPEAVRRVRRTRYRDAAGETDSDGVAHEEPLEIQVEGISLAVLMRTPGDDIDLVTGFLLTEGIVSAPGEIASVHHQSTVPEPSSEGNVVRATLRERRLDLEALRRNFFAGSSCGVCGKASLEHALATAAPLDDDTRVDARLLYTLPDRLRDTQGAFDETGGLHAAGLFVAAGEAAGTLLAAREDVGRHNAVDKVVGWAARQGRLPLGGHVLLVSGRISFEIVQKALAARIPVVAAVSAPTSLAVALAEEAGISLAAFLRGPTLSVYGAPDRIRPA